MKGFSFLVVMVFVLSVVPLLSIEYNDIKSTNKLQDELIKAQSAKNIQEDIIRTLSEVSRECTKSEGMCDAYLLEWMDYWRSKGFKISYGEIKMYRGTPVVVSESKPSLYSGVLRPTTNVSNYGIILKGDGYVYLVPRGDYR